MEATDTWSSLHSSAKRDERLPRAEPEVPAPHDGFGWFLVIPFTMALSVLSVILVATSAR
jgi:hypothetical protein